MLVFASPLLLLAAVLVKATSRGPILYSQIRLGRGGKPFRIYKVRSMYHECEKHSGAQWCKPGDSRITPVGRFLRRTHIDELPQLWNVLRGDMSLVGPRPERPEFIPQLEDALPRYRERLLVRPGLSGLAQVQLPPDTDLDSVRRKLAHDLGYVERMSFWLDLRILICTGLHVLGVSYAWGARKFRLPVGAELEQAYSASLIKPIEKVKPVAAPKAKTTKVAPPDSVDEPLVADLQPA
jgi:lipopolysaccharide/colanic/teichoic acid biosynthesis glycosyltransferase